VIDLLVVLSSASVVAVGAATAKKRARVAAMRLNMCLLRVYRRNRPPTLRFKARNEASEPETHGSQLV